MSDESQIDREPLRNDTDEDRRRAIAKLLDLPMPTRTDEPEDFEQNGMVLMQREFMKIRAKMLESEKSKECDVQPPAPAVWNPEEM